MKQRELRSTLGEVSALIAAFIWAVAVVLFRRSGNVDPQGMNLFKNVLAMILLAATLPLMGGHVDLNRSGEAWTRLIASGVLGVAMADTLVFIALQRLGASLLAVVDISYAPTIVIFSILILHEPLTFGLLIGGVLVVGGVLLATTEKKVAGGPSRSDLRVGVFCGLLGIVLMALGVVIVKPVLETGDLVEVTLIRLIAGVAAQLSWTCVWKPARVAFVAFVPSSAWRSLVPASILGTYVAMLFWLAGFKWADASIAAVLNQMSAVFVIVLARIVLNESVTKRRAMGALIATVGACFVLVT